MVAWPDGDPELIAYVEEQQNRALSTYEVNPDLMEEHVEQEASFRTGGYGQRQISELLQNAVDALTLSGARGAIEFRIADGSLYCANEGLPFAKKGVRSVCYAFLSSKREDDTIGRFGLGFKSILGITEHPQIFSRSVSFDFNAPGSEELFASLPPVDGAYPMLRVPSLVDANAEARKDQNIAEMMEWASTIIKLPLARDGKRIRDELSNFTGELLLFMKSVDRLTISLQNSKGELQSKDFRRSAPDDQSAVTVSFPDSEPERWFYAERDYAPSDEVLKTLPDHTSRKKMTVSYAVPAAGSRVTGEFWAWFPLDDRTTTRGLFNAPWQVNDDRTKMLAGSRLNGEMLAVCAELFLDVALNASTKEDPAAHLDLFPARGRESRGAGDTVLTELIPELARRRPMIPDAKGVVRTREWFKGVPDLSSGTIPVDLMASWQRIVTRDTMPHASAFAAGKDRYTRLRTLLRDSRTDDLSAQETPIRTWLEELARVRTPDAIATALRIYSELRGKDESLGRAMIVPLEGGEWARADSSASTLLPRLGEVSPTGVALVDETLAADPEVMGALKALGFQDVSTDEIAKALAALVSVKWTPGDWEKFWDALNNASPMASREALRIASGRDAPILVRTVTGAWRPAVEVFVDARFPSLPARQPDPSIHASRGDLLAEAGCLTGATDKYPIESEPIFEEYRRAVTETFQQALNSEGVDADSIEVPSRPGAGPLSVFIELEGDDVAISQWTASVIENMPERSSTLTAMIPLRSRGGGSATLQVPSAEMWALSKLGLIPTSRGLARPTQAVSSTLREYGAFLPVTSAEIGLGLALPSRLDQVSNSVLEQVLTAKLSGSPSDIQVLVEILGEIAQRDSIKTPAKLPAIAKGEIALYPREKVVLGMSPEDIDLLEQHETPYLPASGATLALQERWGLATSTEVLSRSIDYQGLSEDVPVLDEFPSLAQFAVEPLGLVRLARAARIVRKTTGPSGERSTSLSSTRVESTVIVDESLDAAEVLSEISAQLSLGLSASDVSNVLAADEALRKNELIANSLAAANDADRLLLLVGVSALKQALPDGLLAAIEAKLGRQSDAQVADLYLRVKGNAALRDVRGALKQRNLQVPEQWAAAPPIVQFVQSLGFPTAFAGNKTMSVPSLLQVQGRVEISELHEFQRVLADKVQTLALEPRSDGSPQRGLLYLPTGAGKTRVTVQAVVEMFVAGKLTGPILWIAQTKELCDQAVQTWSDVWKALGDERVLDVSRFWGDYELDESDNELQVVVAIDDKLKSRLEAPDKAIYNWLREAKLVIVDEAHTAGSPTYTQIFRWLGLTAAKTERPLLGLTATPYRGRNEEVNRRFTDRFGKNRLESLDPEDPIGQLRRERVLAEVDHEVLEGGNYGERDIVGAAFTNGDVSKSFLEHIGKDLKRTQRLIEHVAELPEDWPVLVFAASVASAHTIAALLQLEGKRAAAVDGSMRGPERRRVVGEFGSGEIQILVNCDLLTQGFDAPRVRALYIARPTFSPNRYHQMIGRGLRGPKNGGTDRCLIVNVRDTFEQFGEDIAFTEFEYLWAKA